MNKINNKSILIEIVSKTNSSDKLESFLFSLPPDSITIDHKQRVSRTKTFGGIFEDDYGVDNGYISISGLSGLESKDLETGMGDNVYRDVTGSVAQQYFVDHIINYKNLHSKNYDQYEMRYYDLSSNEQSDSGNMSAYIVSLDEYKHNREKSNPLWHKYTLNLFIIRPLGIKQYHPPQIESSIQSCTTFTNQFISIWNDFLDLLGEIDVAFQQVEVVRQQIQSILRSYDTVKRQIEEYISQASDLISFPVSTAIVFHERLNNLKQSLIKLYNGITDKPKDLRNKYYRLFELLKSIITGSGYLIFYGKSKESIIIENLRLSSQPGHLEISLDKQPQDVYYRVRGYEVITITNTTNFNRIARDVYGDPSLKSLISTYNKVDLDRLGIGTEVRIPLLRSSDNSEGNQVYDLNHNNVNGRDIKVERTGSEKFELEIGSDQDLLTVGGHDNVIQAVNLRLADTLGNRVRLTSYGLVAKGIGLPHNISSAYFLVNLRETLAQETRIREVQNVRFGGESDRIELQADFKINNDNVIQYLGAF